MMIYKIATVAIAIVMVWQLNRLVRSGKVLALDNTGPSRKRHVGHVWRFGLLLLVAVALIELQLRTGSGARQVISWLLRIHWTLDALFAAMVAAILFRFNGDKSPRWHRTFVYSFVALFGLVAVTGLALLWQLP